MSDPNSDYIKWYDTQYFGLIQLDKLKSKADKDKISWLTAAVNRYYMNNSSMWRFEAMGVILYEMPIRKTDYIITQLTVTRVIDGQPFSLKYGAIFSHINEANGDITHVYYTACPTYKSCDGEYRKGLLPMAQLQMIKNEPDIKDFLTYLEAQTVSELNSKNISFSNASFMPACEPPIGDKIISDIQDNRFDISIYIQFLLANVVGTVNLETKELSHLTESFWKIIQLPKHITDYLSDIDGKISYFTHRMFSYIKPHESVRFCVSSYGFKILPLTITDIEHIYDIRLDPWRELYIMNKLTKLLVNGVCQTFPFLGNWSILQNIDKNVFDNKINHVKFDHSKIAVDMVSNLEKVRTNTYFIDPLSKREVYFSYGMRGFSEAIKAPIQYAEREIIMSGYGLCIFQEHLGNTVASLSVDVFAKPSQKYYNQALYNNYPIFCKFLFEQLYGLHCMNTRLGIVHGDLHLNNVTHYRNGRPIRTVYDKVQLTVFDVDGKFYSFPTYNVVSAIIDFSRSFIWNRKIMSADFDKKQMREIKLDIKHRLLRILENELPDFTRPRLYDIEFTMKRHFDLVYDIFKAIDCYRLMTCHEQLVRFVSVKYADVPKIAGDKNDMMNKILPFVKKIKQTAYNFITMYLEKLINLTKDETLIVPAFNKMILTSMFEEFAIDKFKPVTDAMVINFASDSNELRYSADDYDKLPELLKLDYSITHNVESDTNKIKSHKEYLEYLSAHDIKKDIQDIVDTIKVSQDELRGIEVAKNTSDNELIFD